MISYHMINDVIWCHMTSYDIICKNWRNIKYVLSSKSTFDLIDGQQIDCDHGVFEVVCGFWDIFKNKMSECWRQVAKTIRKLQMFHEWGILKAKPNSEATNLHHFFSWLQIRSQKYTLQGQMASYEESGFFKKSIFRCSFFLFGGPMQRLLGF